MFKDTVPRRDWRARDPVTVDASARAECSGPRPIDTSTATFGGRGLPPVISRLLLNRGISDGPDLDSFLNPVLHDPGLLPGMDPACDRLLSAINRGESIGVFGDFDVDGVTGTALMAEGLTDLGATVVPYIPDRVIEGHGPNVTAIRDLRDRGISVLVTVDCGITSTPEVILAQELGIDVIITDHHIPPADPLPALAIVSPKVEGSEYPFPELSGAGLAFKLVQGLCELTGRQWKRDLLELAALSTVADLVPLRDENRFLVKEGLAELRRTRRPGLRALYRRAGIRPESIDAETISFGIAPRLNAAGRLDHAAIAYRLLLTSSLDEAEAVAAQLEGLNRERQQRTEEAWNRVLEKAIGREPLPLILVVTDDSITPGIAGLVASRLVDRFHRPAVAVSLVEGVARGSARSIAEFDLMRDGLSHCRDLFTRHGGHSQAAGFQMSPDDLPKLKERLERLAAEALGDRDLRPSLEIDAEVSVKSLTGDAFRWLKELEPYGVGNPRPTFLSRNLRTLQARPMGAQGRHLRLKLKEGGAVWDARAFRQGERTVTEAQMLDVVYNIGTDWCGGSEVLGLNVLDFRPSA